MNRKMVQSYSKKGRNDKKNFKYFRLMQINGKIAIVADKVTDITVLIVPTFY